MKGLTPCSECGEPSEIRYDNSYSEMRANYGGINKTPCHNITCIICGKTTGWCWTEEEAVEDWEEINKTKKLNQKKHNQQKKV